MIIHSHTSYVVLVSSDFARATKQPNMRLSDSFLVVDRIVTNKHVINNVEYHFKDDISASNTGILILMNVGISSFTWFHVVPFTIYSVNLEGDDLNITYQFGVHQFCRFLSAVVALM